MDNQINIDVDSLPILKCECGSEFWLTVTIMKKVSAIVSPSGQEGYVPIQNQVCMNCGKPIEMSIENDKKEEVSSIIKP